LQKSASALIYTAAPIYVLSHGTGLLNGLLLDIFSGDTCEEIEIISGYKIALFAALTCGWVM
jgi:hypothetical protein